MPQLPLRFERHHLYVEIDRRLWLFDTGAPTSFGASETLEIAEQRFALEGSYCSLSPADLSELTGVRCEGLLGADILSNFDHVIDIQAESLTLATSELPYAVRAPFLSVSHNYLARADLRLNSTIRPSSDSPLDNKLTDLPIHGKIDLNFPGAHG